MDAERPQNTYDCRHLVSFKIFQVQAKIVRDACPVLKSQPTLCTETHLAFAAN